MKLKVHNRDKNSERKLVVGETRGSHSTCSLHMNPIIKSHVLM
jgi:hypothetical protein